MEYYEDIKPLIDAFDLMWGRYPEPAMLIHKNKTLIAVNKACREFGREPGTICEQHGLPEHHADCRANESLETRSAKFIKRKRPDDNKHMVIYWLPIAGYDDYYIHFSSGSLSYDDD